MLTDHLQHRGNLLVCLARLLAGISTTMAEESPWNKALLDNQDFLEFNLRFKDIRTKLLQGRVISDRDSDRIMGGSDRYDQISILVDLMRTKEANAYCTFLESVKRLTGQDHIYRTLNKCCSSEKAKAWERKLDGESEDSSEPPLSQPVTVAQDKLVTGAQDKSRLEEMIKLLLNKGTILEEVVIQDASEQLINCVIQNGFYGIRSDTRGRALIISNWEFDDEHDSGAPDFEDIETNKSDANLAQDVLVSLHFKTSIEWNKTAKEIHQILEKESTSQSPMYDAFVLVLLSHGGKGFIYGTDGNKIYLETEDNNPGVYSYFYNDCCDALNGKPKIFFIQACQSESDRHEQVAPTAVTTEPVNPTPDDVTTESVNPAPEDVTTESVNPAQEGVTAESVNPAQEGVTAASVNPAQEGVTAESVNPAQEGAVSVGPILEGVSAVSVNTTPDAVESRQSINPNKQAHTVKFISTCPGDKAFADDDIKGWFMRAVRVVLRKCAHDTDILEMCNIIQEILGKLLNEDGHNQMAAYTSTLGVRKFYFLPGYKGPNAQNQQHPTE